MQREIESNLLGAIFAEPRCFWEISEKVGAAQFIDNRNREIYAAITSLAISGVPFDTVSVRKKLREDGKMEVVTEAHLRGLLDFMPDVANVGYYAGKLREEYIRAQALQVGTGMRFDLEEGKNVKEVLDKYYEQIVQLYGGLHGNDGAVHISVPVAEAMERLQKLREGKANELGIETGVPLLDDRFAFLAPKNVYVVCGGVSAGKSALSDQIADEVASQGENVYISCLEMSAMQRAERFISRRSKVSIRAFQAKEYLSMEAERRLGMAAEEFASPPIYIDDDRGITTMDIMARAKRFKDTHGLGLLIIDYIQLIKPVRRGPREQEIAEISGAINDMAGALNIPIISVCQLSRTHQHEGREPALRDLRESGRLEQDAFGVIAVYRPDLEESACKLMVLKNRQGPLGRREMRFVGEQVRFEELRMDQVLEAEYGS
jgi:replicative DNA helicase